jgi:ABC-2 type transport system ATP-binding protein
MTTITVEELIRRLDSMRARGPIPFDVKKGEIFGLLCPNGSGKSTLVSILTTLLIPMPDYVERSAFAIFGNLGDVRRSLAIVFQEQILDPKMTGRENLDFHARLHGIGAEMRERRIRSILDRLDLADCADLPVKTYSPGLVKRFEIARSLVHNPTVLLLAEPTRGLDSQSKSDIWDLLNALNRERGVTIILTSHQIEEIEYLCSRVAIVDGGEIVALDTPETFRTLLGGDVAAFELKDTL